MELWILQLIFEPKVQPGLAFCDSPNISTATPEVAQLPIKKHVSMVMMKGIGEPWMVNGMGVKVAVLCCLGDLHGVWWGSVERRGLFEWVMVLV